MQRIKRTTIHLLAVATVSFCTLTGVQGQTVIMEYDVNEDTIIDQFGKNSRDFAAYYFGYGMVTGDKEGDGGLDLSKNESRYLDFGMYYKRRITEWYSITGEVGYRSNVFIYKPDNTVPPTVDPRTETVYSRMIVNNVHAGIFSRFNYGKRGNVIGRYLALGACMDYGYLTKTKEKKKLLIDTYYESEKVIRTNLDYIRPLAFHAEVHLGFNTFVLTGAYRLNDLIERSEGYQVPRVVIGLRIDTGAL